MLTNHSIKKGTYNSSYPKSCLPSSKTKQNNQNVNRLPHFVPLCTIRPLPCHPSTHLSSVLAFPKHLYVKSQGSLQLRHNYSLCISLGHVCHLITKSKICFLHPIKLQIERVQALVIVEKDCLKYIVAAICSYTHTYNGRPLKGFTRKVKHLSNTSNYITTTLQQSAIYASTKRPWCCNCANSLKCSSRLTSNIKQTHLKLNYSKILIMLYP